MKDSKKYRDQIDELVAQLEHVYIATGKLRELALPAEKKYFNLTRIRFDEVVNPLKILSAQLSESRADTVYKDYSSPGKSETQMF